MWDRGIDNVMTRTPSRTRYVGSSAQILASYLAIVDLMTVHLICLLISVRGPVYITFSLNNK